MNYWLVKSEPEAYSWDSFVAEKRASWTGVRNFQARNNLRTMCKGDLVLFYHSVSAKEIVGVAQVTKEAYPDPTAKEGDWSCVDLVPFKAFSVPVSLDRIKAEKSLQNMALLKQSRLSVTPLTKSEFQKLMQLGGVAV